MIQYNMIHYNTGQYITIQCITIRNNTSGYDVIRYYTLSLHPSLNWPPFNIFLLPQINRQDRDKNAK